MQSSIFTILSCTSIDVYVGEEVEIVDVVQ